MLVKPILIELYLFVPFTERIAPTSVEIVPEVFCTNLVSPLLVPFLSCNKKAELYAVAVSEVDDWLILLVFMLMVAVHVPPLKGK